MLVCLYIVCMWLILAKVYDVSSLYKYSQCSEFYIQWNKMNDYMSTIISQDVISIFNIYGNTSKSINKYIR